MMDIPWREDFCRPESYPGVRRYSRYLRMRDGARIAIDVNLPVGLESERLPAIIRQTRYHRRLEFKPPFDTPAFRALFDQHMRSREFFVKRGYAWIDVCARGSGASSGKRDSPWSADEVLDGREIVEWIVRQAWSNGRVGARGVSYDGTAAEFLLSHSHPAVRAVAPRFALYDTYEDIAMPGGIHLEGFTREWAAFNDALDRNRFDEVLALILRLSRGARRQLSTSQHARRGDRVVSELMRFRSPAARGVGRFVPGVAPVDEDPLGDFVREHIRERAENLDVHQAASGMTYRGERGLSERSPELSVDDFSPHTHLETLRGNGAIFHYSGWFDGAYQKAAVKRLHAHGSPADRLIIGPWEHGGRQEISPWSQEREAVFDHEVELLAFFDGHLLDNPEWREVWSATPRVRYFTMGAERWQTSDTWPPPGGKTMRLHLSREGGLRRDAGEKGEDRLNVQGRHGTGKATRWNCLLPLLSLTHYEARGGDILSYISETLAADLEVTGHPVIHLEVVSTSNDPRIFVYLEDVAPDGSIHYVTEGMLRAIHRKQKRKKPPTHADIPYRTFRREDHRDANPGEVLRIDFDLLPTSYLFRRGHALRLSIAGEDVDHFEAGGQGTHTILRGFGQDSWIDVPYYEGPR